MAGLNYLTNLHFVTINVPEILQFIPFFVSPLRARVPLSFLVLPSSVFLLLPLCLIVLTQSCPY
jgi:hypothetical protein